MHLIMANKLYSSWSMRPWLVMKSVGLEFEETVVALKQPDTKQRIGEFTPSGRVPVLIDGDMVVWESVAIISVLSDMFPDLPIWPQGDIKARAHAKAISLEMHAGFQALRQICPMNLGKRFATPPLSEELKADIARLEEIWRDTRQRFGGEGGYLFGDFSAADAMYAPVVTRLDTYQLPVGEDTREYMDTVLNNPLFLEWKAQAFAEPWTIEAYEAGHTVVEDLRAS
ncbi:MAG: glutathione S-transferase family protein [Alphaproteobacteria bacterium]|nr:glutathione S-transferase family protein [Alphaproteobacteria bacterium]